MNDIQQFASLSFVCFFGWILLMGLTHNPGQSIAAFNFKRVLSLVPTGLAAWPFYGRILEGKLSGTWQWVAMAVMGLVGVSVVSLAFVVRASSKSSGKEESDRALTTWLITGFVAILICWISAIVTIWVHI